MALVTFRNLLDEDSEFKEIEADNLLAAIRKYASTIKSKELHNKILYEKVVVYVDGEYIKPDNWFDFLIENKSEIIVTAEIGEKAAGFVMLAVGVVLMAVGGYTFGLTTVPGKMLFMAGMSMALGGLSNILFQPNLPKLSTPSRSGDSSQTYNWDGIGTVSKTDIPVSIVYGTHMVGGNVISLFTEAEGNDNYLYMLLGLCEGRIEGICQKNDHDSVCTTSSKENATYATPAIEIDDQPIDAYDNVSWWARDGSNLPGSGENGDVYDTQCQKAIPYFNDANIQYNDNREITTSGITYNTNSKPDMVKLKLSAPSLYTTSGADILANSAKCKIEYKKSSEGDDQYHAYTADIYHTSTSTLNKLNGAFTEDRIDSSWFSIGNPDFNYYPLGDYIIEIAYAYYDSQPWILVPPQTIIFKIYDYSSGNLVKSITVRLPSWVAHKNAPPPPKATISFYGYVVKFNKIRNKDIGSRYRIKSILDSTSTEIELYGKSKTALYETVILDMNNITGGEDREHYDIRLTRTDGGKTSSLKAENNLILESVNEITQGNFIYPNTALLGLRIKATGQLYGSPPGIKVILKGKKVEVPDHSGSEDFDDLFWSDTNSRWEYNASVRTWDESTYVEEYSDNSILNVRDLMLNKRYGLGKYIDSEDIYSTGLIDTIKECHSEYIPTDYDLMSWWDNKNKLLEDYFILDVNSTISYDGTARSISISESEIYQAKVLYTTPPVSGINYTFSITLSNTSKNLICRISQYHSDTGGIYLAQMDNKGDGTHTTTITFKSNINAYLYLEFFPYADETGDDISFDIDDISITQAASQKVRMHTYNGVLDTQKSALTMLFEMCDSFRTWPIWLNGKFSFVVDKDDTPIHVLSTGNMIEFSQMFTPVSEIPYKLVGQFTDKDLNYDMNSLTAIADKDTLRKVNESTVGLAGLTDKFRAKRELIFKLNKAINQTHGLKVRCGLDSIHATAGDIVYIAHDLPSWADGGRVLSYDSTNASIVISEEYNFTSTSLDYVLKYQTAENDYMTATVDVTATGSTRNLKLESWPSSNPKEDAVIAIGKSGDHKKFRITSAVRTKNNEVDVELIKHVASIYDTASIKTFSERYQLPDRQKVKPDAPSSFIVSPTSKETGIGFSISVNLPNTSNIEDVILQMSNEETIGYETIGFISSANNNFVYIDNNLELNKTYYFRAAYRTPFKTGEWAYTQQILYKKNYALDPPSGIHIKGKSSNSSEFDGRDVTIVWNPVGTSYQKSTMIKGYRINVYHTSYTDINLLRTSFIKNEEYTYKLEDNIGDSKPNNPYSSLIFELSTVSVNDSESESIIFSVSNSDPTAISGLKSTSLIGGARFEWDETPDSDLMHYQYKTRLNSNAFPSTWNAIETNYIERTMSATEITDEGHNATIFFNVRSKDLYHQTSSTASINIRADKLSDNALIQSIKLDSGISGTTASLYDGNLTSGGVTI